MDAGDKPGRQLVFYESAVTEEEEEEKASQYETL